MESETDRAAVSFTSASDLEDSLKTALEAFYNAPTTTIDDDGVAYNKRVFARWTNDGYDRLYAVDPGDGFIDLQRPRGDDVDPTTLTDDPMIHPNSDNEFGAGSDRDAWAYVACGWLYRATYIDRENTDWPVAWLPATPAADGSGR